MSYILGIDLGTSNSVISIVVNGKPIIIPNKHGSLLTPSVVTIREDGTFLIGEPAVRASILEPKNTITNVKRLIGRRYNEVFDFLDTLPYEVVIGENNLAIIKVGKNIYSPQFISALILRYLKESAEKYLGQPINRAVITIPANFNDIQRMATKEAGIIAGFKVERIINEPTAAAMAYGIEKKEIDSKTVVFDLGGGTFDISILELGDGVFEVLSINGDNFLGGNDFDEKLMDWLIVEINRLYDIKDNQQVIQRIKEQATFIKKMLSNNPFCNVEIPHLKNKNQKLSTFKYEFTRDHFNEICEELWDRIETPCLEALTQAGLSKDYIDEVILIGGASRMHHIENVIKKVFNAIPVKSINPDEAVALGAGIQAGVLTGGVKDVLLLDVVPHTLGIEIENGISSLLIEKNTTIPTKKSGIYSTMFDNQSSVEINIIKGDNKLARDNVTIGTLYLENIKPKPRKTAEIAITFDIDANGVLKVSATDKETNYSNDLRIKTFTGIEVEVENFQMEKFQKRNKLI